MRGILHLTQERQLLEEFQVCTHNNQCGIKNVKMFYKKKNGKKKKKKKNMVLEKKIHVFLRRKCVGM